MAREFNVIIEEGQDGYFISEVIEIPGCRTQAKSIEELMERTKEAISLCLEVGSEKPKQKFIGLEKVAV
jgi:predicted RNase H-like HicB family nuclease